MKENRSVFGDVGWADTIPDWLLEEVKAERLMLGLVGLRDPKGIGRVGDAETCVFLCTASLRQPLDHYRTEVYIYLTAKLMDKRDEELPDFVSEKLEKGLSQDEDRELNSLRSMIYRKRGGEINHPLLNAMRGLKKEVEKDTRKLAEMEEVGQQRLEVFD